MEQFSNAVGRNAVFGASAGASALPTIDGVASILAAPPAYRLPAEDDFVGTALLLHEVGHPIGSLHPSARNSNRCGLRLKEYQAAPGRCKVVAGVWRFALCVRDAAGACRPPASFCSYHAESRRRHPSPIMPPRRGSCHRKRELCGHIVGHAWPRSGSSGNRTMGQTGETGQVAVHFLPDACRLRRFWRRSPDRGATAGAGAIWTARRGTIKKL
jgi:hypothetical protein